MLDFLVGQQVVCVDDKFKMGGYGHEIHPKEKSVYTIRHIGEHPDPKFKDSPSCLLEEIVNPECNYSCGDGIVRKYEPFFALRRFKPCKKTDISVFTAMLNPTPIEVLKEMAQEHDR